MISINLLNCGKKVFTLMNILKNCEKFNGISLPEKENFDSHLNMVDISNADLHTQKEFVKFFSF